jgi:hypothetical protein
MVGPGGMHCACCAPRSGNKYAAEAIRKIKRQAIKRYGRIVDKEVIQLLQESGGTALG